jgi:hypothetical protein
MAQSRFFLRRADSLAYASMERRLRAKNLIINAASSFAVSGQGVRDRRRAHA